jgi:hypothetical protein
MNDVNMSLESTEEEKEEKEEDIVEEESNVADIPKHTIILELPVTSAQILLSN